ncbi:hypothetical protein FIBSPDRAFT_868017 [Athelia psychrophila]|uniref:Uncharacterized protein n=1 Tax=Athelia psychrophila TaxID=1759441 RepID=A0A166DIE3_9AGAM|nr:hypothetical protein FIBSPDRAFT_868017 [Fibularhizoctonia sp. CBS 109695]
MRTRAYLARVSAEHRIKEVLGAASPLRLRLRPLRTYKGTERPGKPNQPVHPSPTRACLMIAPYLLFLPLGMCSRSATMPKFG